MITRVHRFALSVYRRLPVRARRRVVRTIAPAFTVGSICIIERANGDVLLARLSYRDRWGLPGGLLKRGEGPADAARREVLEESGLSVELVGEPAVVVDGEARRVDVIYRARPTVDTATTSLRPSSPEIVELQWFSPVDLPELQHEASTALMASARTRADGLSSRGSSPADGGGPSRGAAAS